MYICLYIYIHIPNLPSNYARVLLCPVPRLKNLLRHNGGPIKGPFETLHVICCCGARILIPNILYVLLFYAIMRFNSSTNYNL